MLHACITTKTTPSHCIQQLAMCAAYKDMYRSKFVTLNNNKPMTFYIILKGALPGSQVPHNIYNHPIGSKILQLVARKFLQMLQGSLALSRSKKSILIHSLSHERPFTMKKTERNCESDFSLNVPHLDVEQFPDLLRGFAYKHSHEFSTTT